MAHVSNYDAFARDYAAENESSLLNAYYERPAMLALAGDVQGQSILDAGCGAGPLTSQLQSRGATVSGFDLSEAMINIARTRVAPGTDLRVADLAKPLPYERGSFDLVVSSLVFHYLEDWSGALGEAARVLRPGGRLILSVNHPLLFPWIHRGQDYFKTTQYTDEVELAGRKAELTYWHRPLHAMTDAFGQAGFAIEKIAEPPYSKDAPEDLLPPNLKDRDAFISFIFFVLRTA